MLVSFFFIKYGKCLVGKCSVSYKRKLVASDFCIDQDKVYTHKILVWAFKECLR